MSAKLDIILLLIAGLLTSGCVNKIKNSPKNLTDVKEVFFTSQDPAQTSKEKAFTKSYELNTTQTSYLGEAFISVKESIADIETKTTAHMQQNKEFTLHCQDAHESKILFSKNDIFDIQGQFGLDAANNTVIYNEKMPDTLKLLVSSEGDFLGVIESTFGNLYKLACKPSNEQTGLKFSQFSKTQRLITHVTDTMSYELIYTGKTPDTLMLTYREYTGDNMARSAFFQNLTYSTKQKQIRFKNLLIQVISSDNEKIVFKVLKD